MRPRIRHLACVALALAPGPGLAVAPEDQSPPPPTPTTTVCAEGEVWDGATETCRPIEQSRLPEDLLRRTARELAYAGRSDDALDLLARSDAAGSAPVLTLTAFAHGRAGRLDKAIPLYEAALAADPEDLLARAYMGLALIAAGREDAAAAQLSEIRQRGGAGSWPDRALARALVAGAPIGY
jgi:tetratricopeptide (TPR) repeat protein